MASMYTGKIIQQHFSIKAKILPILSYSQSKIYSHPANRSRTGDLEISTLRTSLLQSPALPTELSRVVSLSCELVIAKHA